MENTSINWCNHTFNPWMGCAKASPGCLNCYAETLVETRFGRAQWGVAGTRTRTSDLNWKQPLKWNKEAAKLGNRYKVFCASLADVFEDRPELETWREELHDLVRKTTNLDWLFLTKRPEFAARYYETNPVPTNVWLGTSVEDRTRALERIPILASIPAKVRFLSCEPLLEGLGSISLDGIHWVIVGGESGPKPRPIEVGWVRSVRDQCRAASVPFLFKQWGGRAPKSAGRLLDGVVHRTFPA